MNTYQLLRREGSNFIVLHDLEEEHATIAIYRKNALTCYRINAILNSEARKSAQNGGSDIRGGRCISSAVGVDGQSCGEGSRQVHHSY